MDTLQKLQDHLVGTIKMVGDYEYKQVAPAILCVDGSSMSVQASETHYSTPRENRGPYTSVEVWNCGVIPAWEEYGDEEAHAPYAYVPINLVVAEIDRRGGFKEV